MTNTTFAVEGCCHGDLDRIYEVLGEFEKRNEVRADFMICCGDFQAIRNSVELETLACPPVYRHLKDFHKYWKEESIPRCLTLFVGGNHEAPGHLREMYFGGFAARDIFYMGSSGVFRINGLRIAGISGIYKSHDYEKPIFESPPYTEDTKRSAYHVRRFEVDKLMQIEQPVDIVVSHDWPTGITQYGDTETMLRLKDRTGQLRGEINSGQLGNPHTMALLKKLKPKLWLAGHMHIKYAAIYEHADGSITRFLALDKCIPRRPFLQFLSMNAEGDLAPHQEAIGSAKVCLDLEWLAILRKSNEVFPVPGNTGKGRPSPVSEEEIEETRTLLRGAANCVENDDGEFEFPQFGQLHPGDDRYRKWMCEALGMRDRLDDSSTRIQLPPVQDSSRSIIDEGALFFEDF